MYGSIWQYQALTQPLPPSVLSVRLEPPQQFIEWMIPEILGSFSSPLLGNPQVDQSWNIQAPDIGELPAPLQESWLSYVETPTPLVDQSWNIQAPAIGELPAPVCEAWISFVETPTPLIDQSWNVQPPPIGELPPPVITEWFSFVEFPNPQLVDQSWSIQAPFVAEAPHEQLGSFSFVEAPSLLVDQSWNIDHPFHFAPVDEIEPGGSFFAIFPEVTWTSFGFPILWVAANHTGTTATYLEVYMRATAGTAMARLYDLTGGNGVTDSRCDTTSATPVRVRTPFNFLSNLVDNHEYVAQFGKVGADAGVAYGARMIMEH